MSNMDNFKDFVRKNPILVNYIHDNSMSWQKFYELYDLYGENSDVWDKYLIRESSTTNNKGSRFSEILDMAKNIDTNKLQNSISSLQKAIGLVGDMITKDKPKEDEYVPRPVYKRFDD